MIAYHFFNTLFRVGHTEIKHYLANIIYEEKQMYLTFKYDLQSLGVGYSMTRKLSKLDVQTCGQLQRVALSTLRREFGPKTGEGLHKFSIGQDDRPVKGDKQRKSVSAEVNYGIRFSKVTGLNIVSLCLRL